jgi:hypothetical protein
MNATAWSRPAPTSFAALSVVTRPVVWIPVLAFLLYVQPAVRVAQLNPDVVEYVDIARRLVAGEGYLLGVKAYHFGGTEVLHDGLAERPPLFTLIVAGLFGLGFGLPAVQVLNSLLAAGCALLIYGIGSAAFDRRVGTLAGLLAAASPVVLLRMVPPMTEALAIFLALAATWLVTRHANPPRVRPFFAAGVALGLGYLTRPATLVLVGAVMAGALLAAHERRRLLRPLASAAAGALLFIMPISLFSLVTRGTVSYSGQTYLYSVFKDSEVVRNGYSRPLLTPYEFISQNPDFIVAAVTENAIAYAQLLFLDRQWLLPLVPGLAAAVVALMLGRLTRKLWPLVLVAATNFLAYAATWSNYQERYQLLTLLLLLPISVGGLDRLGLGRIPVLPRLGIGLLHVAAFAVALSWFPAFAKEYRGEFEYGDEAVETRTDAGLRWTGPPRWVEDRDLPRLLSWIEGQTEPRDALAHGQPWPFTFFTGRPATLLPTKLDAELLRSFVVEYRVAYVLLDTGDRSRRDYESDLEALVAEGVRETRVGRHRIFETRSLWR